MEFSSSTGMSFRTRPRSNSPRAGIRCSATHSRSKHKRASLNNPFLCTSKASMGNLLKLAIEAHGGLEHWRKFNVVRANASITGALWHLKGQQDVLKNVQVVAQLHRQHLVTHLIGIDRRTIFTIGQISIESESGV